MQALTRTAKRLTVTFVLIVIGVVALGYMLVDAQQIARMFDVLSPRITIGGIAGVILGTLQGRQWRKILEGQSDVQLQPSPPDEGLNYRKSLLAMLGLLGGGFAFYLVLKQSVPIAYLNFAALILPFSALIITFFGGVMLVRSGADHSIRPALFI